MDQPRVVCPVAVASRRRARRRRAGAPLHGGIREPDRRAGNHARRNRVHRPGGSRELRPRRAPLSDRSRLLRQPARSQEGARERRGRRRPQGRSLHPVSRRRGHERQGRPASPRGWRQRPCDQHARAGRAALHDRQPRGRPNRRRGAVRIRRAKLARPSDDRCRAGQSSILRVSRSRARSGGERRPEAPSADHQDHSRGDSWQSGPGRTAARQGAREPPVDEDPRRGDGRRLSARGQERARVGGAAPRRRHRRTGCGSLGARRDERPEGDRSRSTWIATATRSCRSRCGCSAARRSRRAR